VNRTRNPNLTPEYDEPLRQPIDAPAVRRPCEHIDEFRGKTPVRLTPDQINLYCGGSKDCSAISQMADGVKIVNTGLAPIHFSDVTSIPRRRRGKLIRRPAGVLHKFGIDIGYGDSDTGPGGYKYCLLIVDFHTRFNWIYGLKDTCGSSIVGVLQQFFIDAGGIPAIIQTDFDPRLLGGAVRDLLRFRQITLRASPPDTQSKNGLVESHWKQIVIVARTFLASSNLPKCFWFWACREAALRLNMAPANITVNGSQISTSSFQIFYT
jgi:hypothetical protein